MSLKRIQPFMFGLLLAIGTVVAHAEGPPQTVCCEKPAAQYVAPVLDQKALDLLAETSNRLAAAETLSFTAAATDERTNFAAARWTQRRTSEVLMQRPDKLRVITNGEGPFSQFYYDGGMITEFSPSTNFSIATTAPPTIDGALIAAYNSDRIYLPFTEILVGGRYTEGTTCFENAVYLGRTHAFDGTTTDLIAYTINGVFVQLWIGVEDRLPRMLLAVFQDDPLQLRHQLEFSNWQVDQPVNAQAFNVNNAIIAAQESMLPSGTGLPMMNAPVMPAR